MLNFSFLILFAKQWRLHYKYSFASLVYFYPEESYNRSNKSACPTPPPPLRRECVVNSVVYSATVTSLSLTVRMEIPCHIYVWGGGHFKARYYFHIKSFRNEKYRKNTWNLKENQVHCIIRWGVLQQSNTLKIAVQRGFELRLFQLTG